MVRVTKIKRKTEHPTRIENQTVGRREGGNAHATLTLLGSGGSDRMWTG
jgi:hypothetical protein